MAVTVNAPKVEPQVPDGASVYAPSPTAEEFIHACASGPISEFRVLSLTSSRGEGKTTAAIYALFCLGQRLAQDGLSGRLPLRVAVVRDTFLNIQRTTIASLRKQASKGLPIEFIAGGEQALMGPYLHLFFFGMDRRADVDKLQGFEAAALWLEEVAPGAELDVGIPAETFGIGATSLRQEGVPHRILMTMNPPDSDHWSLNVDQVLAEKGLDHLVFRRFEMPPGERSTHFNHMATRAAKDGRLREAAMWREAADDFDRYRSLNEAFLESIGRHDLVSRMVHGKVGGVQMGEAVISTFERDLHLTEPGERLIALPSAQLLRAWDGGMTPSTVWIQETAAGNIDVLGSRTSINLAMSQHILNEVIPFQEKFKLYPKRGTDAFGKGQRMGWDFRDVGDPALFQGDMVNNAEISAGTAIENLLNTIFEPGPIEWAWRRDAGNLAFERAAMGHAKLGVMSSDGRPRSRPRLIRIQHDQNDILIKGAAGRFHYVVNMATGRIDPNIKTAKRASGLFAQPIDALLYYLAMRFPAHEWMKKQPRPPGTPEQPPRDWSGV
jgi:hypothetical protein